MDYKFNNGIRYINLISGFALIIMSLLVMVGWGFKSIAVIQVSQQYVPMQFNTALCFLFLGVGLIGVFTEKKGLILASAIPALLISGITFIEYLTGSQTGLDELFFRYNLSFVSEYPGRMALNTSICFVLSGVTVFLYTVENRQTIATIKQILASIVLSISGFKLYGYIFGLESALVWMDINRMAVHTASGFFLFAFTVFISEMLKSFSLDKPSLSPSICVGIILLLISIGISQSYNVQEDMQKENQAQKEATYFAKMVRDEFLYNISMLQLLSSRELTSEFDILKESYQSTYKNEFFLKNVKEVDQTTYFNEDPASASIDDSEGVMYRSSNSNEYTLILPLNNNSNKFVEPTTRYLLSEVNLQVLFESMFKSLIPSGQVHWVVLDNQGTIIASEKSGSVSEYTKGVEVKIHLLDEPFTIRFFYKDPVFEFSLGNVKTLIVFLLVIFTVLSSVVVYFAQRIYHQKVKLQNTVNSLAKAKFEAEQANIAKTSFLSNLSHEIRTPLNGIICGISLTQMTDLDEKQEKYISRIEYCGNMLLNIINDTLDISKIESGRLELTNEPVNLHKLIHDLSDVMSQNASEKKISFVLNASLDGETYVLTDELRLKQVLQNLVANAIKFTKEGSVTLTVNLKSKDERRYDCYIEVKDTGIGIKAEFLDTIFEKFNQVDNSTTRNYGGTGLGLAICKQLVELFHGKIGVRSELEVGSTFWVKLPFVKCDDMKDSVQSSCSNVNETVSV